MKIIYKILGWYRRYRLIMWISGVLSGVLIPGLGYGIRVIAILREKRILATDNPEIADELNPEGFWDYMTGMQGTLVSVVRILLVAALVFLLLLIVAQILSFVTKRTEVSGVDEKTATEARNIERIRRDVEFDDYD